MARAREFEEHDVIERALQVFWHRGYNATSLDDLLEATALSKSSLYGAFGAKRELLVAALQHYAGLVIQGPAAALQRPGAGRAEIQQTFDAVVAHAATRKGQRGCFINNCTTEIAPHDPTVLKAVRAARQQLESGLLKAVRQGQLDGTVTRKEDAAALAKFLLNTLSGINLGAKTKPGKAALSSIARVAMRALD